MSQDELIVGHVSAWRSWLKAYGAKRDAVWLVLAKKVSTIQPTFTYAQALEEALCYGWIDGQKASRDARTFLQRFTPRRSKSPWSVRNVAIGAGLSGSGDHGGASRSGCCSAGRLPSQRDVCAAHEAESIRDPVPH